MGIEQNLDEMIKSLQRSVDDLSEAENPVSDNSEDYTDISTSDLQKILEEKYFSEGATGNHETDGNYELDDEVLAQFYEENAEEELEEELKSELEEEPLAVFGEDDLSDLIQNEIGDINETLPEDIEALEDNELLEQLASESLAEQTEALDPFEDAEKDEFAEQTESIERYEEIEEFDPIDDPDVLKELEALEFSEETEEYDEPVSDYEEFDVIDTHTLIDLDPNEAVEAPESVNDIPYAEAVIEENTESVDESEFYEGVVSETVKDGETAHEAEENEGAESAPYADIYGAVPAEKPRSFKSLIMDYGKADPLPQSPEEEIKTAISDEDSDYETPDVGDILSDFADDSPTRENKIDSAVHKFMNSLGCEEELSEVSAEDIGAIYGQFGDKEELENEITVTSAERIAETQSKYRKGTVISTFKLLACAALTLVMFLYDTLPIFEVEFIGFSDYVTYPGAYVIIGTQLLLICAAVMWRDLWNGIKGFLTAYPNIYSMATAIVFACVSYDMIFFITGGYKPQQTPMFHFLCGMFLTVVSTYSMLMHMRESATFNIYSADVAKFTLSRDKGAHSVGEKMYSGGFSKDKRVYMPSAVIDPKGYSDAIADNGSFYNIVYSSLILTSVGVGVIFGIVLLIVGKTIEEGSIAAMSVVMALMPVSAIAAIIIPLMVSYLRLRKRGIGLTGRKMIKKYGAQNAIVFSDLHLFSKCDPKRIGFECYEKIQTKNVLAALNILYSRIGGPMGEVFANIPSEHLAKSIRVRRITQSGIEAVVDRSHVLLVGDMGFMRRYGIEFPLRGESADKDSIFVSLDGRATARLIAVYEVEPVFDMLIERLSAEGIHCVIETYDPMINTAFVSRHRRDGRSPISVVHKNAADINRPHSNSNKRSDHGLLVLSSRLKLAEALVWCSRLCKLEKQLNVAVCVTIGLGFVATVLLGAFGLIPCFAQYLLFAYMLLSFALVAVLTLNKIPQRTYFTVGALADEDDIREMNERKKKQK